eukprot:NODE_1426_length_1167_cov_53.530411_g1170_i0.p2 GENE.NODE_1426_length_1167_cov_53.530411_g1170_i0~~NODE_1426_length_1167_cov_53.530411_g1170_i0.p2  ORF type:complete len:188 (+),score=31.59 NODE_1426_length_1167_cov_53.530411_g1170_i0:487-1050(+)
MGLGLPRSTGLVEMGRVWSELGLGLAEVRALLQRFAQQYSPVGGTLNKASVAAGLKLPQGCADKVKGPTGRGVEIESTDGRERKRDRISPVKSTTVCAEPCGTNGSGDNIHSAFLVHDVDADNQLSLHETHAVLARTLPSVTLEQTKPLQEWMSGGRDDILWTEYQACLTSYPELQPVFTVTSASRQ